MPRREDGFSLIEVVVALGLAAILMASLTLALANGLNSLRTAKQFQQATALGSDAIEKIRDMGYDGIVMNTADANSDPRVSSGKFTPPGGSPEDLADAAGASPSYVNPHKTTTVVGDNESYTVSRYVTRVDATGDLEADYKRITVLVEWTTGRATHTYHASTLITKARRGLPTPKFDLTPFQTNVTVQRGSQAVLGFRINNRGIVDAYDITIDKPASRPWAIKAYRDENGNQTFDAPDSELTDTNATGVIDTGNVGTDEAVIVFAVWTVGTSEPLGSGTVVLHATSGADPSVTSRAQDGTVVVTVVAQVFTLFLHARVDGAPPTGHMDAVKDAAMNTTAPSGSELFNYSADVYPAGGRYLTPTVLPDPTQTDLTLMANWVFPVPNAATINDVTGTIWVAEQDGSCTAPLVLHVYLRYRPSPTSDAGTLLASGAITVPTSLCPTRQMDFAMPVVAPVTVGGLLELKIEVDPAAGKPAHLGYDTTSLPAVIVVRTS